MKTKAKIMLISLSSLFLIGGTGLSINYLVDSTSVKAGLITNLKEEYPLNSNFEVPEYTFEHGGVFKTADFSVKFPGGTSTINKQFVLSEVGQYTIHYYADFGSGVYLEENVTFMVKMPLVTTGEKSSVEYGSWEYSSGVKGLKVNLAEGETLEFNHIIDLSEASKNDMFITCYAIPDEPGVLEFGKLVFTLTDVTDPDTYIKIRAQYNVAGRSSPQTWLEAGGNGQPLTGYQEDTNTVHVEGNWGTPIGHAFYGVRTDDGGATYYVDYDPNKPDIFKGQIRISYDAEENAIYRQDYGYSPYIVIDFDNPEHFTNLWSGFKSDKVKLSISGELYDQPSANFIITSVAGGVDLSSSTIDITEKPIINIDTDYETMPNAVMNMPYKIPEATAYDYSLNEMNVTTKVWYNYSSSTNKSSVLITNGSFTPKNNKYGDYAIVYEAKDVFGNTTEKILWVNCNSNVPVPTVSVPEAKTTNAYCGELVEIPAPTLGGGSGNLSYDVYVSHNDIKEKVENSFRASVPGTYKVTYVVTDYVGQTASASYDVSITDSNEPVFVDLPEFDKYLISESEYTLPTIYAKKYNNGTITDVLATISITDGKGTVSYNCGDQYKPMVNDNLDDVTINYKAGNTIYSITKKCVQSYSNDSSRRLSIANYFVTEGVTLESDQTQIDIHATDSTTKLEFANKLISEGFEFNFKAFIGKAYFDGIRVKLTDSLDSSVSLTTDFIKTGATTTVTTVNGIRYLDSGFTKGSSSNEFTMGFSNNKFTYCGKTLDVYKDDSGKAFLGFLSDYVYLTIEFINPDPNNAAISITQINNQGMSSISVDRIAPLVSLFDDFGGTAKLNDNYKLIKGVAGDVLDPHCSFTLTVYDPNNNVVTDVNGIRLENVDPGLNYEIKFTEYGQYLFYYSSSDTFNYRKNVNNFSYAVTVEDCEAPVISVNGSFKTNYKVDDVIIMPQITLTDNVSSAEDIVVNYYVYTPYGNHVHLPVGSNSFKVKNTGTYIVKITALDEAGNFTVKTITVVVE